MDPGSEHPFPVRSDPPAARQRMMRELIAAGLIAVAVFVVMGPVREFSFVQWDDVRTIAENRALNPPTAATSLPMWDPRQPYMDLYVPLTYTTWAIVASLASSPPSGAPASKTVLDPGAFHTTNLLLHALSGVLAFAILKL